DLRSPARVTGAAFLDDPLDHAVHEGDAAGLDDLEVHRAEQARDGQVVLRAAAVLEQLTQPPPRVVRRPYGRCRVGGLHEVGDRGSHGEDVVDDGVGTVTAHGHRPRSAGLGVPDPTDEHGALDVVGQEGG